MIGLTVTGVRDVQRRCEKIAQEVAAKVVQDAALDSADPMVSEMKLRTPVYLDRLRPGIAKQLVEPEGGKTIVRVGPTRRRFVARFLEYGTKKMSARPFVRPALEAARGRVVEAFRVSVANSLGRIVEALS